MWAEPKTRQLTEADYGDETGRAATPKGCRRKASPWSRSTIDFRIQKLTGWRRRELELAERELREAPAAFSVVMATNRQNILPPHPEFTVYDGSWQDDQISRHVIFTHWSWRPQGRPREPARRRSGAEQLRGGPLADLRHGFFHF